MTDGHPNLTTPIYDQLVRELYAERTRQAYEATPDMIGCGQWELPPDDLPGYQPREERTRRRRERNE